MRTHPLPEERREPTPMISVEDQPSGRWVLLQPGAQYHIDLKTTPPLESAKTVKKTLGIPGALLAEVYLGPEYPLLIFDRGAKAQGTEEPVIPGSRFFVSDRFLITDEHFMLHAHMRSGMGLDVRGLYGTVEACIGQTLPFGRGYSHGGRFAKERIPQTVSEKHLAVFLDFDERLHIVDAYSTNLTKIHHRTKS